MDFPSVSDFLMEFGIEPVEVDPSMAYCKYVLISKKNSFEVDISFSAVMESFQINVRVNGNEVMMISSEKVESIKLFRQGAVAGGHIVFDMVGLRSEAKVLIEPEVSCRWWSLRTAITPVMK